jgi:hypothetical protein
VSEGCRQGQRLSREQESFSGKCAAEAHFRADYGGGVTTRKKRDVRADPLVLS